ncbi:hypothetical protein B0H15DRAFT_807690 [Mycena belliarum]|uniref:Uncharacterized protein n=1 Tax=Mycena belliarum TaxID=1033014 RepID=A0AAD6TKV8_9AGAR|nr:hypothetical protein B0H15DRAFT_807690 [Mycena belliae]
MPLNDVQLAAIIAARRLLDDAGLVDIDSTDDPDFQRLSQTISSVLPGSPSPAVLGYHYKAPPSRDFTLAEVALGLNSITRQTSVHGLVEHPRGAIIEYPESGSARGLAIAHKFAVDPASEFHPKLNIQYSLGDNHGGRPYVTCGTLLSGRDGMPASCNNLKIACKGLKVCAARPRSTTSVTPPVLNTPAKEVFDKTIAFFCTLLENGCAFDPETSNTDFGSFGDSDSDSDSESDNPDSESSETLLRNRRRPRDPTCRGKLCFRADEYGRPFIQCQKRSVQNRSHLILRNLDEFEIPYLRALLTDDSALIQEYELSAKALGYGPLSPCSFTAPPSAQKQLCPYWHRSSTGKLARGILERWKHNCTATFNIYTPYDLEDCPFVLIICQNPHSHPPPSPVKTPPPLLEVFRSLLLDLNWKLADATPRKLVVESGFMFGLRRHLGWSRLSDPALSELHPSLGNLDHVRRYINALRTVLYPEGTGLEGLCAAPCQGTSRVSRVRSIFHLVICMFKSMSEYLMRTKMLSLDTAFKRIHGKWEEFEMETWNTDKMKCALIRTSSAVVGTRAFTTSQSAQAHLILFTRIFEIASSDTGIAVQFRHIHGEGMELWIADAHKGQGIGAGMFCQSLCIGSDLFCPLEPTRLLSSLTPVEHLRRFYRFCGTHYKRNIDELRPHTTAPVRKAMLSLASSHEHPDLEGALKVIENGGKKAKAWLKDKITGTKFALPALYQPMSLIPLDIWKAAPSTTNGNEQAHRSINRDGVNLTILAGIMRGMQYDARAMAALSLYSSHGIYGRDQTSTHFRRLQRSVNRQVLVQRRVAERDTNEDKSASTESIRSADSQLLPPASAGEPSMTRSMLQQMSDTPLYTTQPLAISTRNPYQTSEQFPTALDYDHTPSFITQQLDSSISEPSFHPVEMTRQHEFRHFPGGDYPILGAGSNYAESSALPFVPGSSYNGTYNNFDIAYGAAIAMGHVLYVYIARMRAVL